MTSDLLQVATGSLTGGIGIGGGLYLFRWLFDWLGLRADKRQEALNAQDANHDKANQALIDNLLKRLESMNSRITTLEHELDECRKRDAESQARIARLEAQQAGFGDARQHAQLIVAAEKREAKG